MHILSRQAKVDVLIPLTKDRRSDNGPCASILRMNGRQRCCTASLQSYSNSIAHPAGKAYCPSIRATFSQRALRRDIAQASSWVPRINGPSSSQICQIEESKFRYYNKLCLSDFSGWLLYQELARTLLFWIKPALKTLEAEGKSD